jgi:hypothetical protein
MKIEAINERFILYKVNDQEEAACSPEKVIQKTLSVKNTKGLVSFLDCIPYKNIEALRVENSYIDSLCQHSVSFNAILYSGDEPIPDLAKGLRSCLEKHFLEISYLDSFALNSGDFGKVGPGNIPDCPPSVDMTGKGFAVMPVWCVVEFVAKVQAVLRYAAAANRGENCGLIKTIEGNSKPIAKTADYGFEVSFYTGYSLPVQSPDISELFDSVTLMLMTRLLKKHSMELPDNEWPMDERVEELDCSRYFINDMECEVPVYPPTFEERDIAANMVTSIIVSELSGYSDSAALKYEDGRFSICRQTAPMRDLFLAIAELAVADTVHLCPVCKIPVIEKRVGDRETYCSNSCKTKANNNRRDKAHTMAAAGIPIEQAVETIGGNASTIKRWYKEAHKLIDSTDTSTP